ncbi:hypothetical protein ABE073_04260 [Lederbergia citrisecunda]|uniref:hypothetical protein n=1 Tax=Lederbergia citrisecunda TaxID=2833583 RepID=UPI003D2C9575
MKVYEVELTFKDGNVCVERFSERDRAFVYYLFHKKRINNSKAEIYSVSSDERTIL